MRVIVSGDFKKKKLLDTKEATGILIETDDGVPTVIFRLLSDGKGWMRLTKGEDKEFNNVAKQLGLI